MKAKLLLATMISICSINYSMAATYSMKYFLNEEIIFNTIPETWIENQPVIGIWVDTGDLYSCSNWSESEDNYSTGVQFNKTRDCKQDQSRTTTYTETSNKGNTRESRSPLIETHTIDKNIELSSLGTRFTHTMVVGFYNGNTTNYGGYFSENYKSQHFGDKSVVTDGSMTPSQYKGYDIDHLVEYQGDGITLRLLPAHATSSLSPVITIDGVRCQLMGPGPYSDYNSANCGFNLKGRTGQTIKIDMQ